MAKDELKQERMKILDLLSKGIISAEDAEKLLSAMSNQEEPEQQVIINPKKSQFRMLKILVDSADGDNVKIELPIEFAKLLKSSKINMGKLDDLDVDVDAIIQLVNSGAIGEIVNITSADGDIVKILVE
jgi:hypothetical protein